MGKILWTEMVKTAGKVQIWCLREQGQLLDANQTQPVLI